MPHSQTLRNTSPTAPWWNPIWDPEVPAWQRVLDLELERQDYLERPARERPEGFVARFTLDSRRLQEGMGVPPGSEKEMWKAAVAAARAAQTHSLRSPPPERSDAEGGERSPISTEPSIDIRGTDRIPVRPTSVDVIREAERSHLQDIVNAGGSEYERFSIEEMQRALAEGPPRETVTQRERELSGVLEPADRMRSFFEEIGMSGAHRPAEKSEAPADVRARIGISSSAIVRGTAAQGPERALYQSNTVELMNRQTQQPIGRFRIGDYVPGLGSIDDIDLRSVQRPGRPEIKVPSVRIVPDDETLGPYWLQGDALAPPGTEDILAQRISREEFEEAVGHLGNLADITGPWETPTITSSDAGDAMRRMMANEETGQVPTRLSDLDQAVLGPVEMVATEAAEDELLQDLMSLDASSPEEAALRSMRGGDGGAASVEDVYGVSMDGEDFIAVDTAKGTYYYNSDTGENFWEYGGS